MSGKVFKSGGGGLKSFKLKWVLAALLSTSFVGSAFAGGFAIREQSAYFQGMSFAGNGAGGSLSSMFWNPATVSEIEKFTMDSNFSYIIPDISVTADSAPFGGALSTDIGKNAIIPSSYGAMKLTDKLTLGVGVNAPYGLVSKADDWGWAGRYELQTAKLFTMNFNPVVSYKLADWISVGAGPMVQYTDLTLKQFNPRNNITVDLQGDDWSWGFTAGVLLKPMAGTSIGVGYRSQMDLDLRGRARVVPAPSLIVDQGRVAADFTLPETVTVSLRQELSENFRVMATYEWTKWSRLKSVPIQNQGTGTNFGVIEANYENGWMISGGIEWDVNHQLTLRAGYGFEHAPAQEPEQRLVSVPDDDRHWLSLGGTFKYTEHMTFHAAYTHIIMDDRDISRPSIGAPLPGFTGEVEGGLDIISVGATITY